MFKSGSISEKSSQQHSATSSSYSIKSETSNRVSKFVTFLLSKFVALLLTKFISLVWKYLLKETKKKTLWPPFYGWGSTASRLEPLRGGSLLKFPEIPGTHFIDLRRMKGWVDLGATPWFWTRDSWIGNPAT